MLCNIIKGLIILVALLTTTLSVKHGSLYIQSTETDASIQTEQLLTGATCNDKTSSKHVLIASFKGSDSNALDLVPCKISYTMMHIISISHISHHIFFTF